MQQPRGDTRGSPTRESKPSEQRGEHDSQTDKRDAHHSAGIPSHTVMGSKKQQLLQRLQPAFSARTEKVLEGRETSCSSANAGQDAFCGTREWSVPKEGGRRSRP